MKRFSIVLLAMLCVLPLVGARNAAIAENLFWEEPTQDSIRYQHQMDLGDRLAVSADTRIRDRRRIHQLASMAIDAYLLAVQINPKAAEPHYRIALVIHAFLTRENVSPPRHLRREIEHYNLFEKKAPLDPRIRGIVFSRAIARTKLMGTTNLQLAVLDYDRSLEMLDHSSDAARQRTSVLGNRAELLMMLGRMRESIATYELALQYSDQPSTGYGLAVALDRDGQRTRARQVAAVYARSDSTNILTVRDSGIFFVPSGEVHYYIAIRAEGLGNLQEAAAAYRLFLKMVPTSRWVSQATKNLEALNLLPKKAPRRRRGTR